MSNAKHTAAALFAVAMLTATTSAIAKADEVVKVWECFNSGDSVTPVVRAWASGLARTENNKWVFDNAGIEMNGMSKPAAHTEGIHFNLFWHIPSFVVDNDGAVKEAIDDFIIEGNGVGKYKVQKKTLFAVQCKRQQ